MSLTDLYAIVRTGVPSCSPSLVSSALASRDLVTYAKLCDPPAPVIITSTNAIVDFAGHEKDNYPRAPASWFKLPLPIPFAGVSLPKGIAFIQPRLSTVWWKTHRKCEDLDFS